MRITEYGCKDAAIRILAIPGLFMNAQAFEDLSLHLPEYHIVAFTLDAHYEGAPEYPGREEELNRMVELLLERDYTHFDLCIGLSLGTIMAVTLAERGVIEIDRFLLDGAVNFYRSNVAFLEKAAMSAIFHSLMKKAQKNKDSSGMLDIAYIGSWQSIFDECHRSMTDPSIKILINELSAFSPEPGLTQPMYCIYGSKENNVKACKKAIKNAFPQARFSIKNGYNHLTWLNHHPDLYARLVTQILSH